MKMLHKKLTQPYFDEVKNGKKTFELRKNDCNYQVGDILVLQEYAKEMHVIQSSKGYFKEPVTRIVHNGMSLTGNEITTRITYMLEDYPGLEEGYCILGIEVI